MHPLVSIIIPTRNSSRTLENCLISIKNQTYSNIEIIVVDNFSSDGTDNIARKYTENVYQKGPERTEQKNYGIEKAKGKFVCFIDSDMELTSGVIASCVQLYGDTDNIGGICIPEDSVGKGLFVQIRAFERSFYTDTQIESARFFHISDVRSVGGFEVDLIFFEESLLPQKIQLKLQKGVHFRIHEIIHHHEGNISLGNWLAKKFYYGKSLDKYRAKVKEIGINTTADSQIGIVGRYLIFLSDSRFYTRPILATGVLLLKTMEFGAGGLGLLSSKISE